jgi:hypothetical protein
VTNGWFFRNPSNRRAKAVISTSATVFSRIASRLIMKKAW